MQLLRLIALAVMLASVSASSMAAIPSAGSLPAFNPLLTVNSLIPQQPANTVTNGYFRLTPDGCNSGSGSSNGQSSNSGACSGFSISNDPSFATKVNSAVFAPASDAVIVDPMQPKTYEIGTLTLTNNGFMQPMGAAMTLVPVKGSIAISVPNLNQPTNLAIDLQVMWSLGSPALANTAGIFALVTANPQPSYPLQVAMSTQRSFSMNLKLLGFVADTKQGAGATVLGDWGKQNPKAGEPGPRVYVEEGSAQVVKLFGMITNAANSTG